MLFRSKLTPVPGRPGVQANRPKLTPPHLWKQTGPVRVPDLPGGVAINPSNPSRPGLVHYQPLTGRTISNPRPPVNRMGLDNLARALTMLPQVTASQLLGPVARTAQAVRGGHMPSRTDLVNTLSLIPYGPKMDRLDLLQHRAEDDPLAQRMLTQIQGQDRLPTRYGTRPLHEISLAEAYLHPEAKFHSTRSVIAH